MQARRRQVAYARERGLPVRRACTLFSTSRSSLSYQSRKTAQDAPALDRMKRLSEEYPRYGYRRVRIFLARDGHPTAANHVWSYDFVFDYCANGQKLKCLTVTDEFTKEGLAIDVQARLRAPRVIEVLSQLVSERGAPAYLRSDNGPEFVSIALLGWIAEQKIGTALIDPGKPWQNGVIESFNGKFRDECLSLE